MTNAALTLGANDPNSRLRIIAEFMKGKSLEEDASFLQAHYGENGAGFFVGKDKYSLWYDGDGLRIAPGESAQIPDAMAVTWEQAAGRIRELMEEGRYASQDTLERAWPYERQRIAEALAFLCVGINDDYRGKYLTALSAALVGAHGFPETEDKIREIYDRPEQLKAVISEFSDFVDGLEKDRNILRFSGARAYGYRPKDVLRGLKDMQISPIRFTASPDYAPVERFFISQDEIDDLLRDYPDGLFCFQEAAGR